MAGAACVIITGVRQNEGLGAVKSIEAHPSPRTAVGRYIVIDELGRGGMGVVYHAYDPAIDRAVALKILAPELAQQHRVVSRLRREAINTARLRHPNIALLYEFGQAGDTPFLAMEYVAGQSLRSLLDHEPLPLARVLTILAQIAQALDYAHSLGIVHRDVKPSNIVVGADDHATLIDFGVAEMIADGGTADVTLLGTPHYMAPEQASGHEVDGRNDQYALAAVAYELFSGVPPFHGRVAAAVVHAHIYEPPPPPSERAPMLPSAVNAALLRALAKHPDDRFPTVAAFVAALAAATTSPAIPGTQHRRWLAGAALIALATLTLLLSWWGGLRWPAAPPEPPPESGVPIPRTVAWMYDPGLTGRSAPVVAGHMLVFETLDGALVALESEGGSFRWRKEATQASFGPPSTGAGQLFVGSSAGEVSSLEPATGEPVWHQQVDGAVLHPPLRTNDRLLMTTGAGSLYALHTGSGALLWQRRLGSTPGMPAVGDGSVFVAAGRTLYALDWNSGTVRWSFEAPSAITSAPAVAGQQVLIGTARGRLYGLRVADGTLAVEHQARGTISATPAVGEMTVFVADQAGTLTALERDSLREVWRFEANGAVTAAPLLADDKLLFGTSSGAVYTLDPRSGRQLSLMQLDGSIVAPPTLGANRLFVRANRLYALAP